MGDSSGGGKQTTVDSLDFSVEGAQPLNLQNFLKTKESNQI